MHKSILNLVYLAIFVCAQLTLAQAAEMSAAQKALADEVRDKGWLIYSAKTAMGDFDLFACRPNGMKATNITRSPVFDELGARFSPNGKKLLYRRLTKGTAATHDNWGALGTLVVSDANGHNPKVVGETGDLKWASWGPDDTRVACLFKRQGQIRFFDTATQEFVGDPIKRGGIFQQLFWSSDGKDFVGTGNIAGSEWNIVRLNMEMENTRKISSGLSCTGDWFMASSKIIYAHRQPGGGGGPHVDGEGAGYGWTDTMMANRNGGDTSLIYSEQGKHSYFASTSPDDRYVVVCRLRSDAAFEGPMVVMRLADAPIKAGRGGVLPEGKAVLYLDDLIAFEPTWTYEAIKFGKKKKKKKKKKTKK